MYFVASIDEVTLNIRCKLKQILRLEIHIRYNIKRLCLFTIINYFPRIGALITYVIQLQIHVNIFHAQIMGAK